MLKTVKVCPNCEDLCHPNAERCDGCGEEFEESTYHTDCDDCQFFSRTDDPEKVVCRRGMKPFFFIHDSDPHEHGWKVRGLCQYKEPS